VAAYALHAFARYEQDFVFNKLATEEEIKKRLERSNALLKVGNMTKEIRNEIDRLVIENREFVNRVTMGNIPITKARLDELVEVTFKLYQRLKDPIVENQKEVKEDVNLITKILGDISSFGQGIYEGFSQALNPPQDQMNEIALKTLEAQAKAQAEYMKRVGKI